MDNLDKNIEDIALKYADLGGDIGFPVFHDEVMPRIKQAFIDDGWVKLSLIRGVKIENEGDILKLLEDEGKTIQERIEKATIRIIDQTYRKYGLMTGQEWCNQFEDEFLAT